MFNIVKAFCSTIIIAARKVSLLIADWHFQFVFFLETSEARGRPS